VETGFGPLVFNEKSGATVIGVRDFLVAYNVNLNTNRYDARIPSRLTCESREDQDRRWQRPTESRCWMRAASLSAFWKLKHVKAIGWFVKGIWNCPDVDEI